MQFSLPKEEQCFYDTGTTANKRHLVFRQPRLLILHIAQLGPGEGKGLALNASGPVGLVGHPLTL